MVKVLSDIYLIMSGIWNLICEMQDRSEYL